ncbi:hypothetical protein T08_14914 [Trichinella sp. T8]|nr:hypothetical protein T08_14914 [Trichinella sp. T8]
MQTYESSKPIMNAEKKSCHGGSIKLSSAIVSIADSVLE